MLTLIINLTFIKYLYIYLCTLAQWLTNTVNDQITPLEQYTLTLFINPTIT